MSRHSRADDTDQLELDQAWLVALRDAGIRAESRKHAQPDSGNEPTVEEVAIPAQRTAGGPVFLREVIAAPAAGGAADEPAEHAAVVAQTSVEVDATGAAEAEAVTETDTVNTEPDPVLIESADAEAEPAPRAPKRRRRGGLRKPVLVGAAALTCLLTVSAGTAAAMTKSVAIVVDGQTRHVTTLAGTVDGALAAAGLTLGAHDTLAPSGTAGIADGATIVLDRGRLLELTINGQQRQVWTTARTVDAALDQLGLRPSQDLQLSANRSREIPLNGLRVSGTTAVRLTLAVGGAAGTPASTTARTVGAVLAERGITLGPLDVVSPAVTTPVADGMVVSIDRVSLTTRLEKRPIPQPAEVKVSDAALEQGLTKVVQPGSAGTLSVTVEVRTVNGREVGRRDLRAISAAPATPRIIHVGTMTPDPAGPVAAAAAAKKFTYQGDEVFTNDTTFGVNWDGLAFCESTHNPKAVNDSPPAGLPTYGMFQFDIPTWASVGGSGNPMDAPASEQLMRAKKLYLQRGLEPWSCRDAAH